MSFVARRILSRMGTKSSETIYGALIRAAAERATEARKEADRLAVEAWNKRMLQQSPIKSGTPVVGHVRDVAPFRAIGSVLSVGGGYDTTRSGSVMRGVDKEDRAAAA